MTRKKFRMAQRTMPHDKQNLINMFNKLTIKQSKLLTCNLAGRNRQCSYLSLARATNSYMNQKTH